MKTLFASLVVGAVALTCCPQAHACVATKEFDDAVLLERINQAIYAFPAHQNGSIGFCVSVYVLKQGHVELATSNGTGNIRALLANRTDRNRDRIIAILQLEKAIQAIDDVRSVAWTVPNTDGETPVFGPPVPGSPTPEVIPLPAPMQRRWNPRYSFNYPQNMSAEEHLELLTSLNIHLGLPIAHGSNTIHILQPHQYVIELTTDHHVRNRERRILRWENTCESMDFHAADLSLTIRPNEHAYAPSRALLEMSGVWQQREIKKILHLYPNDVTECLGNIWRERWSVDRHYFPDIVSPPCEVLFGFRKRADGTWEIFVEKLRYNA